MFQIERCDGDARLTFREAYVVSCLFWMVQRERQPANLGSASIRLSDRFFLRFEKDAIDIKARKQRTGSTVLRGVKANPRETGQFVRGGLTEQMPGHLFLIDMIDLY